MKVYIVTQGDYSDYSIKAVFLDKQKANEYAILHSFDTWGSADCNVGEYDTSDDTFIVKPEERYFQAIAELKLTIDQTDPKKHIVSLSIEGYETLTPTDHTYLDYISTLDKPNRTIFYLSLSRNLPALNNNLDALKANLTEIAYDYKARILDLYSQGYSCPQIKKLLNN